MPEIDSGTDGISKNSLDNLSKTCVLSQQFGLPLPFIITERIEKTDIQNWIISSPNSIKVYWQNKEQDLEIGGIGETFRTTSDKLCFLFKQIPKQDLLFFYARHFSPGTADGSVWADYPSELCYIPETMIIRQHDDYRVAYCLLVTPDSKPEELISSIGNRLHVSEELEAKPKEKDVTFRFIRHTPNYAGWSENIKTCLKEIKASRVSKVVMARRSDYELSKGRAPEILLSLFAEQNQQNYIAYYQPMAETAFISISPERLYRRMAKELSIDAISSTTMRGKTETEDKKLAQSLINDDKQRREHQFVIDGIRDSLGALCAGSVETKGPTVLKLKTLQHLKTIIHGRLIDTNDFRIIEILHPTPAVGGTPVRQALDLIKTLEPFHRGYYAAPIGIISENMADMAVGIRSLVIHGNVVSVFTGAGIVAGSNPRGEWQEIDSKNILNSFIKLDNTQ